jgi:hypothetical protein
MLQLLHHPANGSADDVRGMLNAQLQRLDDRASQYKNSSLDFCALKELWLWYD